MGLSNDYMGYAMQSLNAQQQSILSGDKKLQDFYGNEVTRGVLQTANAQMNENERVAQENHKIMREQQADFMKMVNDQMSEINDMRRQLELERVQFEHTCWFNSLTPEQREAYLDEQRIKEEERLKIERFEAETRQRENEELEKLVEEHRKAEQERRASITPFQRVKEDIMCSEIVEKIVTTGIALGILVGGSIGLMALGL